MEVCLCKQTDKKHLFSAFLSRRAPALAVSLKAQILLFVKQSVPFLDSSQKFLPHVECVSPPGLLAQQAWFSCMSSLALSCT